MTIFPPTVVGGVCTSQQDVVEYSCAPETDLSLYNWCKGAIRAGNVRLLCKVVSP